MKYDFFDYITPIITLSYVIEEAMCLGTESRFPTASDFSVRGAADTLPQRSYMYQSASRLAVLYTYEADLGNGWEDPDVHSDPEGKRLDALKMGANIAVWALSH